jgi:hypothetical protein
MHRAVLVGLLAAGALAAPIRAVEHDTVDEAVRRGVRYLRSVQATNGSWSRGYMGVTALAALTLLECGVAPDDKAVVAATRYVREASLRETHTYSICLAILFLDRLGEPADVPLIESLTVRLLAGQNADGGWSYNCPAVPAEEVKRLTALRGAPRGSAGPGERPATDERRGSRPLSEDNQKLLELLRRTGRLPPGYGDNSNTQFANLALWVAGRHGLPVEDALLAIAGRYRRSQQPDGGWLYTAPDPRIASPAADDRALSSHASMTCAALLGLAIADAGAGDPGRGRRTLGRDPQLRAGLLALGGAVGSPTGGRQRVSVPRIGGGWYYFLWSLERLCVALDLATVGGKDWYAWGAEALLGNQEEDGSWRGAYAEYQADTCFALLFLRRANLARDLTASLRGRVRDPGKPVLRTGVGLRRGTPDANPGAQRKDPGGAPPAQPDKREAPPKAGNAAGLDPAAARLADELVGANEAGRADVLRKLEQSPGVENTEALAAAIGRLVGAVKQNARQALDRRLGRMKAEVLDRYLQDEEPEIRRAAAVACAMRGLRTHVPRLIPLLGDRDAAVADAAHEALKELSGKDLGTDVAAWKAWWARHGKD